jgi:predicted nucleic acid-binding protein
MPPSTTSLFPDINVWVALTYEGHVHHTTAATWFTELPPDVTLAFCRFTQLGLLRLLTTAVVKGPATKDWADSFLAAFATAGHLTLVTFDRGLRVKAKSAILLRPDAEESG